MSERNLNICIFTYNSSSSLSLVLDSVAKLKDSLNLPTKVFVFDNNSTDDTLRLVERHPIIAEIVRVKKQGLLSSRKKVAEEIEDGWVLNVDDDFILLENSFAVIEKIIKEPLSVLNSDVIGFATSTDKSRYDKLLRLDIDPMTLAIGEQFTQSKLLDNASESLWGVGTLVKVELYKKVFEGPEFLCQGRTGSLQLAGEDTELVYRMKLLGGRAYYHNYVLGSHLVCESRIDNAFILKTIDGFRHARIVLSVYESIFRHNNFIFGVVVRFMKSLIRGKLDEIITLSRKLKHMRIVYDYYV